MKIPKLNFSENWRTYKTVFDNYSSEIHGEVVKAWLFDGFANREIDSNILGLDSTESSGWESWKILHYLGINEEFRIEFNDIFKDCDVGYIISKFDACSDSSYVEFINVLKVLDKDMMKISVQDFPNLLIKPDVLDKISASLTSRKNIIFNGVPGTGKTYLATKFAEKFNGKESFILTTATSDWTTFDTIGGLMPNENNELEFHEGKFLQAIRENKWLIIDEINRADIDKSFGQLFTVLSNQDVELPYSIKNDNLPIKIKLWEKCYSCYVEDEATYYIGKNWRIIATMNSYDKNSLFDLSYAFMRRFTFIEIEVPEEFEELTDIWKKNSDFEMWFESTKNFLPKLQSLYSINSDEAFKDINRQLGPAIFLDIIKYLHYRLDLEDKDKYNDKIFSEAVSSFIIPQFEGLSKDKLDILRKFFIEKIFEDEVNVKLFLDKLEGLKPFY